MTKRFYLKEDTLKESLEKQGFNFAGMITTMDIEFVFQYEVWYTNDCIIIVELSSSVTRLVKNIIYCQEVNGEWRFTQLEEPGRVQELLEDHNNVNAVRDTTFMEIFSITHRMHDTEPQKSSKFETAMKKLSQQFQLTFQNQIASIAGNTAIVCEDAIPEFCVINATNVVKIVETHLERGKKFIFYLEFGSGDLKCMEAERFESRITKRVCKEDVLCMIESFIKAVSGIFNKKCIETYLATCSPVLDNRNELGEKLKSLPKYPHEGSSTLLLEENIATVKFKLGDFLNYSVILDIGVLAFIILRDNFTATKSCVFAPEYIEKYVGSMGNVIQVLETVYNSLSWFPEGYAELSNVVFEYMKFFKCIKTTGFMGENLNYLTSSQAEVRSSILGTIDAFDHSTSSGNKTKVRLREDMSLLDTVKVMTGGNPGAMSVLNDLLSRESGYLRILALDTLHVYESDIYALYKDVCGEDLDKLILVLQNNGFGKLTEEEIHAQIAKHKPFEHLMTKEELHSDLMNHFGGGHSEPFTVNAGNNAAAQSVVAFSLPDDNEEE